MKKEGGRKDILTSVFMYLLCTTMAVKAAGPVVGVVGIVEVVGVVGVVGIVAAAVVAMALSCSSGQRHRHRHIRFLGTHLLISKSVSVASSQASRPRKTRRKSQKTGSGVV